MEEVFSYYHEIQAPDGTTFTVWARNSSGHYDLSVEGKDDDAMASEYAEKYHAFLNHPTDFADAEAKMDELKTTIQAGTDIKVVTDIGEIIVK